MRAIGQILTVILIIFAPLAAEGQNLHSISNKAVKLYREGLSAYDFLDFDKAEILFRQAIAADKNFYEAYMSLGELFTRERKFSDAVVAYRKAVRIDSLFYKPVFFSLANAEMMSTDYGSALIHYRIYLEQSGMSEKNVTLAKRNVKNCEFAIEAVKNPVPFNPESVGKGINTTDDEYWPSITADGQTLMFTRQSRQTDNSMRSISQEDFYVSFYSNKNWEKALNAGAPLNTSQNEGAQTLSSNGAYMFFTACDRPQGLGSCDIYFSALGDGNWSEPMNLKWPVNSKYWESQPSVSADNQMLFFSGNRPGGSGGKDIWYSRLNDKGLWSTPRNAGKTINTAGDEMSPFIHFDGKTLYFASDGRTGMGGFDLYMTRMNSDSTWTEPVNLGYPINTVNDETGLIIESGGQKAYYSSVRNKADGKDIFTFNLHESVRPDPVSYLKGRVFDKFTGKVLKADYELINLSSGKITYKGSTDVRGNFLVCLPSGYNYGLNVIKPGYLFYSENFMFEGKHTVAEPLIKRIDLSPINVGEKMQLMNVFYEFDSWELKPESITELDNLVKLLKDNNNLVMEIGGYTDSTGTDEYNLVLSEKRVMSVVRYLVEKGISSDRLKYKGYGNTSPIGDNVTEEGRKLNRRTEAKIIEIK